MSESPSGTNRLPFDQPPDWARRAIWYQIVVERFRNGDLANDPTPASLTGADPGEVPPHWKVTPWGHDWHEADSWFPRVGEAPPNFSHWVSVRRYGGDLQGVLDKLDELQDLGVTALYFNPLNDSPSLHKYDARYYQHIDRHFGPDPEGDGRVIETEDPLDAKTWRWTAAVRTFLRLIADDPATPQNEFNFHGWLNVKSLPELKKVNVAGQRPG